MALRTPLSVTPHLYMGDSTGRPLDMGTVYFGEQDKDPEFYPINLFSDDALTKPLAQPVHTKGGYLYDKGDMVEPHAKEIIYSVKVLDSYGRKVFYKGAMMRNSWNDDVIEQINTAIIGSADVARQVATDITNDAINNTAVDGGVLADTFVVVDGSLSQRTINKGLESIADLSTINNPKDGLRVYVKSYHAGLGKGGGYFTYDSSKLDVNDGGTVINGWVRENVQDQSTNIIWFGAVGDGATDDTLAIQKSIDATPDGGVLYLPSGTYLVKKNTSLANYPNNDQPCLEVRDRNNITLTGSAELIVKEHAQSILEIQDSSGVRVEGISFKGAGNFPPISGTSGRAEKGISTSGYHTSGFWGYKKNNSHDTSKETRGSYPNGFPREYGSTGNTWGVWNGGFIGNHGYGILIVRSDNITISKCTSRYFNGAGFQVGFLQEALDGLTKPSKNITFDNCIVTDNYSVGICMAYNISGVNITNCVIERTGHPDANPSHDFVDPGYGTAVQWDNVSGANITSNIFNDNKRKAVDYHSGIDTIVSNNIIKGSHICGIFFTHTGTRSINGCVITNNYIIMEGEYLAGASQGGIYIQTPNDEPTYDIRALINSNTIVSLAALSIKSASGVTISNNRFISPNPDSTSYVVRIGRPDYTSADISFSGNLVDGTSYFGLMEGAIITNNRFTKDTQAPVAYLGKDSIVSSNSFGGAKTITGDVDMGNYTSSTESLKSKNRAQAPLNSCIIKFNLMGESGYNSEVLLGHNRVTVGTVTSGSEYVMKLKNFTGVGAVMMPSAYYVGPKPYSAVIKSYSNTEVRAYLYDQNGDVVLHSTEASVGELYIKLDT